MLGILRFSCYNIATVASSSGLGRLVLIQVIAGSNPAATTMS